MDSVQIILIEILLVLVTGIGVLFFKGWKKKASTRGQLAQFLKRITDEEPERKTCYLPTLVRWVLVQNRQKNERLTY